MMEERRSEYDPAKLLTRCGLGFVGVLILFVAIIIVLQIVFSTDHSANTESWAAMTGMIGWATSQVSILFNNRFGTTQASAKKDAVIEQQTKTAATIAGALPGGTAPTPAPIVTENLAVSSQNTVVNPEKPNGPP